MSDLYDLKNRESQNEGPVEEAVLTVHIKRLYPVSVNEREDEVPFLADQSILRITIGSHAEEMTFKPLESGINEFTCEQVVHFMLKIPVLKKSPCSSVSFSLLRKSVLLQFEETLGKAQVNLSQLISESPTCGSMTLYGDNEMSIATLEMDLMFNYGCLGFGNTITASMTEHAVMEICRYSLFPRILAPTDKQDGKSFHRTPLGVPKPNFVPFQNSASFYNSYPPSPSSSTVSPRTPDLKLTTCDMKRLPHLCHAYHQTTGRRNKLQFLKNLVSELSFSPELQPSLNHLLVSRDERSISAGLHRRAHKLSNAGN